MADTDLAPDGSSWEEWLRITRGADGMTPTGAWIPPEASYGDNPSGAINRANPWADAAKPFVQAGDTGGYQVGTGVTRRAGTSQTQAEYDAAVSAARSSKWAGQFDDWMSKNPDDPHRFLEAMREQEGSAGGSGGGGKVASAWNSSPQSAWYSPWFETFRADLDAQKAEQKIKADTLYAKLMDQANQSKQIDRNDPIISGQVGAFGAQQERIRRNYLADLAEKEGQYANLRGETRLASERTAQSTSAFEAELLQQELTARRQEIAQALSGAMGLLSAEQTRTLQAELATLDQFIGEQQLALTSRGQDIGLQLGLAGNDLGMRQLGLAEWAAAMGFDLRQRGL